ncbi:MAG: FtsQ-type POTRA domain-containing protein, partial [Actinomycetota bacterium]
FSVATLLVLAIGGWILARSSLFGLDSIEVSGTRLLTRAQILQASGLHVGQNMLSVHAGDVRERIQRLPLVRTVRVARPSPSRLRIVVEERAPSFVLQTLEGRWYLDDEATLLEETVATGRALPTIQIDSDLEADPGDRVRARALQAAVSLWSQLPEALRAGAPEIDATSLAGLTLVRNGMTVRFGTLARLDEKLEAMRLVLARVSKAGERVVTLDLRSPARPAAQIT